MDCNVLKWIVMHSVRIAPLNFSGLHFLWSPSVIEHASIRSNHGFNAEDDIIIKYFAGTFNITPRVGSILFFSNTLFPTHPGNRGFYFRSLKEEEENVVKSPHGEDPIIANFAVGGSHTAYHQKSNTGQPDIVLPQCRFWIITGSDTANKPHLRSTGKVLSEGSDNC